MKKIINGIFWTALLVFLVRVFIVQSYKVEGFTMSSTLIPGDRVLVNKLSTGGRFPNSILGLPGTDRSYLDIFRIPYFRLPKFRDFKRDDIVVYNDPRYADRPLDRAPLKISRLVGMPGDTVLILDKKLYVNRKEIKEPGSFRHLYRIVTDGKTVPSDFLSEYKIEEPKLIADIGVYDYLLDSIAHLAIKEIPTVKTTRLRKQFFGDSSNGYFPYSSFFFWNGDQYGPLIVPVAGLEVDLHIKNIDLYKDIIDIHEANDLLVDYSGITINGEKVNSYTFKKSYYFVMDDNRDKPEDSRIIGFIPENRFVGTCKQIVYSGKSQYEHLGGFKLQRTLRRVK